MKLKTIQTVKDITNSIKNINTNIEKVNNEIQTLYYLKHCLDLFDKLENEKGIKYVVNVINKIEKQ